MTSSAKTDYGTIFGKLDSAGAYPALGEVVTIDPPDFMTPAVEATNHSSGGVRQFISGGLSEMSEFKATLNMIPANVATLVTDKAAGTVGRYRIAYPDGTHQDFGAIVTSIKPGQADAQNPDVLKAEITFRPSDSISLSS
jgi:hypothetical protein